MAVSARLDAQQEETPTLYVVFAGLYTDSRRGTGDIVAVSASLLDARQAFRAVRMGVADRDGWGELTEVADGGNPRRLGWFGVDRWPRANPLAALLRESQPTGRVRRWRPQRTAPRQ
jgi:hypothetical protein